MAQVKVESRIPQIRDAMEKAAKDSFNAVALDVKETSSGASPFKKGLLEKNFMDVRYGSNTWEAEIWFDAVDPETGENYTEFIHDDTNYELGPGSVRKGGTTSRFSGYHSVDRKYLSRVVEAGRAPYAKHIEDSIYGAIK